MNKIEKLKKLWTQKKGRFNVELYERYLKAIKHPEPEPETIDIMVGPNDEKIAQLQIVKNETDSFIIYELRIDGTIIRELKYLKAMNGAEDKIYSVTKWRIKNKEPYLWLSDVLNNTLIDTIKK